MNVPKLGNPWSLYLATPTGRLPREAHVICDTVAAAKTAVKRYGVPTFVDFDYWRAKGAVSARSGPAGFDFARWLSQFTLPPGFHIYATAISDQDELKLILGLPRKVHGRGVIRSTT